MTLWKVLATYLVCTCRRQEDIWWWVDKDPVQTLGWRQGCDRTGDTGILPAPSTCVKEHQNCRADKRPIMYLTFQSIYLDSDRRSAFSVLLYCCIRVYGGTQELIRNTSSIESRQDGHWCPGGALNGECVPFTSVSCVVFQDSVKVH